MALHKTGQKGIAAIETILLLVVIAAVVGIGAWVYKQRAKTNTIGSSAAIPTAKVGTADGIDQLTQQDAADETNIDSSQQSSEQTSAQATNSAQKDVGGAYNDSSF